MQEVNRQHRLIDTFENTISADSADVRAASTIIGDNLDALLDPTGFEIERDVFGVRLLLTE